MNVLDLLRAAGPLLWVLAALSLYVVYLIVLRLQVLSKLRGDATLLFTRVHAAVMQQDLRGALREAGRERSVPANVFRAGLERTPAGIEAADGGMNEALLLEDQRLYAGVGALGTVAQIAPLLGLLGTVFGMVRSFLVFSQTTSPTPTQLATGISEALVNTAGGLIVAVIAYVARNALRTRADQLVSLGERAREAMLSWLHEVKRRQDGSLQGAPLMMFEFDPDTRVKA